VPVTFRHATRAIRPVLRAALARARVNGVHAGRSRASQENDSVLASEARAAWLRLTRKHEDPARS
jgi:hypothetical protein